MSGPRDSFYVDFSNYKDRSSARLPEGEYLVRVGDAEATTTKKDDPMVNVFLTVVGGPYADSPIIDRLTITEKALWRVANALRALGFKVEKRNMNIPIKAMIGRTMVIKVSDGEPYNGEVRSEIRSYAPAGTFKGYDFLGTVEAATSAESADLPVHEEGQPHTLGTAESQGPLGDEVRAQNAAWEDNGGATEVEDSSTQEEVTEEHGDLDVPENGISL